MYSISTILEEYLHEIFTPNCSSYPKNPLGPPKLNLILLSILFCQDLSIWSFFSVFSEYVTTVFGAKLVQQKIVFLVAVKFYIYI